MSQGEKERQEKGVEVGTSCRSGSARLIGDWIGLLARSILCLGHEGRKAERA